LEVLQGQGERSVRCECQKEARNGSFQELIALVSAALSIIAFHLRVLILMAITYLEVLHEKKEREGKVSIRLEMGKKECGLRSLTLPPPRSTPRPTWWRRPAARVTRPEIANENAAFSSSVNERKPDEGRDRCVHSPVNEEAAMSTPGFR